MGKILKETFLIVNKNLWLLFLFMTISYFGLIYFSMLKSSADSLYKILFGLLTLTLIVIAGVAGFFKTLKVTIDAESSKNENVEIIKAFPKGVADYFFSSLGIIFIYFVLTSIMLAITYYLGNKYVGMFSFSLQEFSDAMVSVEALSDFVQKISVDDFVKLTRWHMIYLGASSLLTYLLLYWLPETFYLTKNSFLSLFLSVKKVVFNPIKTLKLFFTIIMLNFFISVVMTIMLPIPVLSLFIYFVYFYGLLFILVLIFNYYYNTFIIQDSVEVNGDVFLKENTGNDNDDSEKE